jgi:hypothetical protein
MQTFCHGYAGPLEGMLQACLDLPATLSTKCQFACLRPAGTEEHRMREAGVIGGGSAMGTHGTGAHHTAGKCCH